MSPSRRPFAWSAALLLSFATLAVASPVDTPASGVCESTSAKAPAAEPDEASLLFCAQADCEADWQCENMCPTALSATCGPSGCEYTFNTGGGGGGGGPFCPMSDCWDDAHCQCMGQQGSCGADYLCHY